MSNIWICVMSRIWPARRMAVMCGKTSNVGQYMQTFQPIFFFIPAMLIGIMDFCHFDFTLLSVTVALLGEGERGSQCHCKAKPLQMTLTFTQGYGVMGKVRTCTVILLRIGIK